MGISGGVPYSALVSVLEQRITTARQVANRFRPIIRQVLGLEELGERPRRWAGENVTEFLNQCIRQSIVVDAAGSETRACLQKETFRQLQPVYQGPVLVGEDPVRHREAVADALAQHVEQLVLGGFLGTVVYQEGTTGAYSYVLRRVIVPWWATAREVGRVDSVDRMAPHGERATYRLIAKMRGTVRHVTEVHVHHLRDLAQTTYQEFTGPVPIRVVELQREASTWLRMFDRHLRVLTGTIVEEEIHLRDERTQELRSKVVKTWKDSPAIVLGDLVLAGWSSDDLKPPPRTLRRLLARLFQP